MRAERHPRWDPHLSETKNVGEWRAENNGIGTTRPLGNDGKPIKRKSNFSSSPSGNKVHFHNHTFFVIM